MKIEDIVSGLRKIGDSIDGSQREVILAAIEKLEKGHHVHYHLAPNHTVRQVGPVIKIDA
jgi:hypothetical protein